MEKGTKWVINPDYLLKKDLDRMCIMSLDCIMNYDSSKEWTSYIHPYQAAILMLFDGKRTVAEIIELISNHFNIPEEEASAIIEPYLGNESPVYTEWQGRKIPFPKNILIKADDLKGEIPDRKPIDMNFDWDKIDLTPDRAHNAPHAMLWMLTSKCVTNCAYCYADKHTKYDALTTERALEIIDSAHKLGVRNIDVIGGEVFLRKDWDTLIGRMVALGMSPSFISTKIPVTEDILNKLLKTGFRKDVQLSMDSLDDDVLSRVVRSPKGYAEKMMHGARLLDNAGFEIEIDTILTKETATKENLDSLAAFFSTIKHFNYWEIRVPGYTLYTADTFDRAKASRSQLEEIREYVDNHLRKSFPGRIILSTEELDEKLRAATPDAGCFSGGLCGLLTNKMFILPDGKVSACEQLYWHPRFVLGDLKRQSIEQIWQSAHAKELFSPPKSSFRKESACSKCKSFDDCNSQSRRCVVKVMKAYGKDNWDYPDPRCAYAPEITAPLAY